MKTKLGCPVCLALVLLLGQGEAARAQGAAPPFGVWKGKFADGTGSYQVTVTKNGGYGILLSGKPTLSGYFTWQPTSRGGIITCHYYNAGIPSKAYYSVTYIDSKTILWSDPYFKVTLKKMGS